jgi:hypothetical protein
MHDRDGAAKSDPGRAGGIAGYGYFMLQAHLVEVNGQRRLRLILEDLETLEKRTFGSSAELGRFLDDWGGLVPDDRRFQPPELRRTTP